MFNEKSVTTSLKANGVYLTISCVESGMRIVVCDVQTYSPASEHHELFNSDANVASFYASNNFCTFQLEEDITSDKRSQNNLHEDGIVHRLCKWWVGLLHSWKCIFPCPIIETVTSGNSANQ